MVFWSCEVVYLSVIYLLFHPAHHTVTLEKASWPGANTSLKDLFAFLIPRCDLLLYLNPGMSLKRVCQLGKDEKDHSIEDYSVSS